MTWQALKRNSSSRSRVRIVEYAPLWSSSTVPVYRLCASSLKRILANIGGLLRHWVVPSPCMRTEPPGTLNCNKYSNSKLATSCRRVDGLSVTAFVNWANRFSMAYLYMYSRAVSLSFEAQGLGAAHHWQKWNASSFSPWQFEHSTLPRMSDTCVSVRGGVLIEGIPRARGDSMASRSGEIERTSPSRFHRACRTWLVMGDQCDPARQA